MTKPSPTTTRTMARICSFVKDLREEIIRFITRVFLKLSHYNPDPVELSISILKRCSDVVKKICESSEISDSRQKRCEGYHPFASFMINLELSPIRIITNFGLADHPGGDAAPVDHYPGHGLVAAALHS